jgi:hypothetical protein
LTKSQLASDLKVLLIILYTTCCCVHDIKLGDNVGKYMWHTIEDQKFGGKTFYSEILMGSFLRRRLRANVLNLKW